MEKDSISICCLSLSIPEEHVLTREELINSSSERDDIQTCKINETIHDDYYVLPAVV